ncbi:13974_t:CDS:2, partial [Dentiscutata erythropus]
MTWGSLIFWRFILGIGIGGCPAFAIITSEFATLREEAVVSAVFAMQGFGILTGVVSAATLEAYRNSINRDPMYIDCVWRTVLVLGVIPAVTGLYFRLAIPKPPHFMMDVLNNIEKAVHDIDVVLNFEGLNILQAIGFGDSQDTFSTLWNLSVGNIIITILGTIPGYWCTVFLIDKWGRIKIQLMGFVILTVLFLIWGFGYRFIKQYMAIFIIVFSLCQLFQNFGPNATTFVVPSEVFPTRYRSTGH